MKSLEERLLRKNPLSASLFGTADTLSGDMRGHQVTTSKEPDQFEMIFYQNPNTFRSDIK